MLNLIKQAKGWLEDFKAILKLVIELWIIAKGYPLLFALVFLGFATYFGLRWYVFEYPKRCIAEYYTALAQQNFDKAWDCLAEDYRTARWYDKDQFRAGYHTLSGTSKPEIEFPFSTKNPLRWLLASSREYIVAYDAHERFTRNDLDDPQQRENKLWLQIANPNSFQHLMDGTLSNNNPSLPMRRFFKESILVKRTHAGWVIAKIGRIQRGLK